MKIVVFILCICWYVSGYAQQTEVSYPIDGQLIPDFILSNVAYYEKQVFTSRENRGKWMVLDFWEKGCTSCVQSFPRINELHEQFHDKVQFLLIANNSRYSSNVEQYYDRFRYKFGLSLAIAYDSVIFEQFGIPSVPYVIIVSPDGKVYAQTNSKELTKANIQALIDDKAISLVRKRNKFEPPVAQREVAWKYWLSDEDLKSDFLYRSVLTRNSGEPLAGDFQMSDDVVTRGVYQVTGIGLMNLYSLAYFGTYSPSGVGINYWYTPIVESKKLEMDPDEWLKGSYNYSLSVPKARAKADCMREIIQRDLQNCFGYEAVVEIRELPYWQITVDRKGRSKFKTKSSWRGIDSRPSGITGNGISVQSIIWRIKEYNFDIKIPIVDETGLTDAFDIDFNADMTNFDEVRAALRKEGLIIERAQKKMVVLVIRDPKPQ